MTFQIYNVLAHRFGKKTLLYFEKTLNPYIWVAPEQVRDVCMFMRDNSDLRFSFFFSLSGADHPESNEIVIVYHLFSMKLKTLCVLKTSVNLSNPELESIESVWKAARWFECEVQELLGVNFVSHSDFKRNRLADEWTAHPLGENHTADCFSRPSGRSGY